MCTKNEDFIERANAIHNNKFDYSKTNYINNKTKVIIKCITHGEFLQLPSNHLRGRQCKKCSIIIQNQRKKSNTDIFIQKAKNIHNDKYDYSKVQYIKAIIPVTIICPIDGHGPFEQTPHTHLNGSGCYKCGKKSSNTSQTLTTEQFISEAINIHGDKFDYSKVIYINCDTMVTVICKIHGDFNQTPSNHIRSKHACQSCMKINASISKRTPQTEFIKKASQMHNNKFDYSLVEYKNSYTKIKIICPFHKQFEQIPSCHLVGHGCPKCVSNLKMTITDFINKVIITHGEKYDYSKVDYINSYTPITIICQSHGKFKQTPAHHINRNGCMKCAIELRANQLCLSNEEFIKKANIVHDNLYDYSKVQYKNNTSPVIIICKLHNEFKQIPNSHLRGAKCQKCSKHYIYTTSEWIEKANKIHDNLYDYSNAAYVNAQEKIIITCKLHGNFQQTSSCHLNGSGCQKCCRRGYSKKALRWLNEIADENCINIIHAENEGEFKIPNSKYKADGYCKDTNTIYEFNGCIFHGCPICYDENEVSPISGKLFKDIYMNTIRKEDFIKDNGYKLVTIWEHEFNDL